MDRRKTLAALLALGVPTWPAVTHAQAPDRVRRIGWLTGGSPKSHARPLEAFRAGLREYGWIEEKNIALELRWAEGKLARLPALAAELVKLKPEVIVTAANVVHLAVRKETSTIPIVMMTGADPVEAGLAASFARPGGNVTGLTGFYEATPAKMLELAASMVPRDARAAVLMDANFNTAAFRGRLREELGKPLKGSGLRVTFVEAATPEDVTRAIAAIGKDRPAVLVVLPGSMIFALGAALVREAETLKVPVIYPFEEMVEAGGLMSYASPLVESYRRAAYFVDRILKGANPGDLPIERPTRLSLAINMNAAKLQGITLPPSILIRADRVIE
jgi:putative ABC transport system substrate-binding protein